MKNKKILIGITGGIAAYKICFLVRQFVKAGAEVKVIMTPSATKFVSPLTLSVLSRNDVIINTFPEIDNFDKVEKLEQSTWHIDLAMWADVFIVAPATANTLGKIISGIADNFLLCTIFASRCPVILVPSMDEDMYRNTIVQRNIKNLESAGYKIIYPIYGELASGIYGIGKMPEPEEIFSYVDSFINRRIDLNGKKILITAGPTREPIDKVRYITNYSSGKMGFELAKAAYDRGADVTLIAGPVTLKETGNIKRIDVETTEDMFKEVKKIYNNFDLIIMAAAVSDFKPKSVFKGKLKKEKFDNLKLELIKNIDILKFLGEKKKDYKLYGFALETENGIENAKKKLKEKNLDLIILNNPLEEGAGFESETNVVTLIDKNKVRRLSKMTKYEVGNIILDYYLEND